MTISNYEKRFRKKRTAVFHIVGISLDFDEIQSGGWDVNAIKNTFEAHWEDDIWLCYYPGMDENFSDTTITKVKRNISEFFRADPAVKSYKKIDVKFK